MDCRAYTESYCSIPEVKCGFPLIGGGTLESMGFDCNLPNYCGGPKTTEGFVTNVPCGGSAALPMLSPSVGCG